MPSLVHAGSVKLGDTEDDEVRYLKFGTSARKAAGSTATDSTTTGTNSSSAAQLGYVGADGRTDEEIALDAVEAPDVFLFPTPLPTSSAGVRSYRARCTLVKEAKPANPDGGAATILFWASIADIKPLTVDSPTHVCASEVVSMAGVPLRVCLHRRSAAPPNGADPAAAKPTALGVSIRVDESFEAMVKRAHPDALVDVWERKVSFEVESVPPPTAREGTVPAKMLKEVVFAHNFRQTTPSALLAFRELPVHMWQPDAWRQHLLKMLAKQARAEGQEIPSQPAVSLSSSQHFGGGGGAASDKSRSHAIDDHAYFSGNDADEAFKGTLVAFRISINVRVDPKVQRKRHAVLSRQARNCFGYVGIQNPGSTCYANALLQVLYHNTITRRAILGIDAGKLAPQAAGTVLQLQRLFYHLDKAKTPASISGLFGVLNLNAETQQDAHEFLLQFFMRHILESTPAAKDFTLKVRYVTRCTKVRFQSEGVNEEHQQLSVSPCGGSLLDAIAAELRPEPLRDLFDTERPELGKQQAVRAMIITQMPKLLWVHVRRFDAKLAKVHLFMTIPKSFAIGPPGVAANIADLAQMAEASGTSLDGSVEYRLQSTVVHHGAGLGNGHYTAMCRCPQQQVKSEALDGVDVAQYTADNEGLPTRYMHFDDDAVYPLRERDALQRVAGAHWLSPASSAYILLYVRSDVAVDATHTPVAFPQATLAALHAAGLIPAPDAGSAVKSANYLSTNESGGFVVPNLDGDVDDDDQDVAVAVGEHPSPIRHIDPSSPAAASDDAAATHSTPSDVQGLAGELHMHSNSLAESGDHTGDRPAAVRIRRRTTPKAADSDGASTPPRLHVDPSATTADDTPVGSGTDLNMVLLAGTSGALDSVEAAATPAAAAAPATPASAAAGKTPMGKPPLTPGSASRPAAAGAAPTDGASTPGASLTGPPVGVFNNFSFAGAVIKSDSATYESDDENATSGDPVLYSPREDAEDAVPPVDGPAIPVNAEDAGSTSTDDPFANVPCMAMQGAANLSSFDAIPGLAAGAAGEPATAGHQRDRRPSVKEAVASLAHRQPLPTSVRVTVLSLTDVSRMERMLPGSQSDIVPCGAPAVFNMQIDAQANRNALAAFNGVVPGATTIERLRRHVLVNCPNVQRDVRTQPDGSIGPLTGAQVPHHLRRLRLWLCVPRQNGTMRPSVALPDDAFVWQPEDADSAAAAASKSTDGLQDAMDAEDHEAIDDSPDKVPRARARRASVVAAQNEVQSLLVAPAETDDAPRRPRLLADAAFVAEHLGATSSDDLIPSVTIYVEVNGMTMLPRESLPRNLKSFAPVDVSAEDVHEAESLVRNVTEVGAPSNGPCLARFAFLFVRVALMAYRTKGQPPDSTTPAFIGTILFPLDARLAQLKLAVMAHHPALFGANPEDFLLMEHVRPHRIDGLEDEGLTLAEAGLRHGDLVLLACRRVRTPANLPPMASTRNKSSLAPDMTLRSVAAAVRRGSNVQYVSLRIIDDSGLTSKMRVRTTGLYHTFALRRRPLGRDPTSGQLREVGLMVLPIDLEEDSLSKICEKVKIAIDARVKQLLGNQPVAASTPRSRSGKESQSVAGLFGVRLWAPARSNLAVADADGALRHVETVVPAAPISEASLQIKLRHMADWSARFSPQELPDAGQQLRAPSAPFTPASYFHTHSAAAAVLQWDHPSLFDDVADRSATISEVQEMLGVKVRGNFADRNDEGSGNNNNGVGRRPRPDGTALELPDLPVSAVLPLFVELTSRDGALSPLPDYPVQVSWLGDGIGEPLQVLRIPKFPGSGSVSLLMHLCAMQMGLISPARRAMDECPCSSWALSIMRGSTIDFIVQSCCLPSGGSEALERMAGARFGPSTVLSKLLFLDGECTEDNELELQMHLCETNVVMVSVSFVEMETGLYAGAPFIIPLPTTMRALQSSIAEVVPDTSELVLAAELRKSRMVRDSQKCVINLNKEVDFRGMLTKIGAASLREAPTPKTGPRDRQMPPSAAAAADGGPAEWELARFLAYYR